jgi:hypothetical protein
LCQLSSTENRCAIEINAQSDITWSWRNIFNQLCKLWKTNLIEVIFFSDCFPFHILSSFISFRRLLYLFLSLSECKYRERYEKWRKEIGERNLAKENKNYVKVSLKRVIFYRRLIQNLTYHFILDRYCRHHHHALWTTTAFSSKWTLLKIVYVKKRFLFEDFHAFFSNLGRWLIKNWRRTRPKSGTCWGWTWSSKEKKVKLSELEICSLQISSFQRNPIS